MKERQYIMVVDENKEMLKVLNRTFELEGYGVTTATNGGSALAILDKHKPDLVILDTLMPELNGFQALNLIRQHSNVPIIMLTARSKATPLRKHRTTNTDDYVRMPFQTRELANRVETKLD